MYIVITPYLLQFTPGADKPELTIGKAFQPGTSNEHFCKVFNLQGHRISSGIRARLFIANYKSRYVVRAQLKCRVIYFAVAN